MYNKQEDNVETNAVQIKPADIKLTHASSSRNTAPIRSGISTGPLWAGIIVLCVIILAAAFIFTNLSKPPATTDAQQQTSENKSLIATTASAIPVVKTGAVDISPWDKAQQTKQRKKTQDILAELLEVQGILEEKGVAQWANEEYELALQQAKSGDGAYRQQDYEQAQSDYQLALETFRGLFNRVDSIFNDALTRGNKALAAGDTVVAEAAFQLALLIEPGNQAAIKGSQRANTLDEVLVLTAVADDHYNNGQLNAAKEKYAQALTLDSDTEHAGKQLKQVKQRILDEKFNQQMSIGYAALVDNEFTRAREAFLRAIKLKPGASEAHNALKQTDNRISTEKIKVLISEAMEYAASEDWQQAIMTYDLALNVDPNIAQALQGKENALERSKLDQQLKQTIARPDRLSEKAVYNEAVRFHRQALNIDAHGATLSQQISVLSSLLKKASTPVQVTLQSNNLTKVTLYKVGEMGRFETEVLSLLPGRYVAVGNREGYRDVRVEFRVSSDAPTAPVIIQCNEKINL